jgi:hypothetical protein
MVQSQLDQITNRLDKIERLQNKLTDRLDKLEGKRDVNFGFRWNKDGLPVCQQVDPKCSKRPKRPKRRIRPDLP